MASKFAFFSCPVGDDDEAGGAPANVPAAELTTTLHQEVPLFHGWELALALFLSFTIVALYLKSDRSELLLSLFFKE